MQTRDLTPGCAMAIKKYKIEFPDKVHFWPRCPGLWEGDLPRDLQEKSPLQSRSVPRAVPWTSQNTKLNPWTSPRYPWVVGIGEIIDSSIITSATSYLMSMLQSSSFVIDSDVNYDQFLFEFHFQIFAPWCTVPLIVWVGWQIKHIAPHLCSTPSIEGFTWNSGSICAIKPKLFFNYLG